MNFDMAGEMLEMEDVPSTTILRISLRFRQGF
jgi:hypothetical protein